ncbi:MAG: hypothetical protein K2I72_03100 [Bacilli bacterium]|nr:hypothetical protein [Bacilli bacterium]
MIHFFRDILDGPVYIIVVIISILAIMGIIGFIMERFKKAGEEETVVKSVDSLKPEKVGTLVISSDSTNSSEKPVESKATNLEKTEVLEIVSMPQVKTGKDLEKTEVLDIVSLPPTKKEENLEKTEVLELNFNKEQASQAVEPIPQVEITAAAEKKEILSINSSDVHVQKVANTQEASVPEEKKIETPVIDFGSTKDVIADRK